MLEHNKSICKKKQIKF